MQKDTRTREETYADSVFEWVKTERQGEICKFSHFDFDSSSGIEWAVFQDNSRINSALVGDVVLMHANESMILGKESLIPSAVNTNDTMTPEDWKLLGYGVDVKNVNNSSSGSIKDPVFAILEKAKKKSEKITINMNVKIPSIELYNVIKDNFKNVDEILLDNVINQVNSKLLKEGIKKELQNIYSKKK